MNKSNGNGSFSSVSSPPIGPAEFTVTHIQIIAVSVFITVILVIFLRFARFRYRQNKLSRIPRDIMPLLRPGDLPRKHHNAILNQLLQSKVITAQSQPNSLLPGDPLPPGLQGWGLPGTDMASVHFRTSVAKSYIVLQRAATHADPSLHRPPNANVREYVAYLVSRIPLLPPALAEAYVQAYERARFSTVEWSEQDFNEFTTRFGELLRVFEDCGRGNLGPRESEPEVTGAERNQQNNTEEGGDPENSKNKGPSRRKGKGKKDKHHHRDHGTNRHRHGAKGGGDTSVHKP